MEKQSIEQLQKICTQLRRDVLRMVHAVQSGHPGAPLGCAEFFVALYFDQLRHNPDFKMDGKGEDLFFLSNGHISPVWYSVLARAGYFPIEELGTFRKLNARLQGHPSTDKKIPGVRMASGSLGQGLSNAIGACVDDDGLGSVLVGPDVHQRRIRQLFTGDQAAHFGQTMVARRPLAAIPVECQQDPNRGIVLPGFTEMRIQGQPLNLP